MELHQISVELEPLPDYDAETPRNPKCVPSVPRIFDNIEQALLPALRQTIEVANHADFCVGYFNLRGWKQLDRFIEGWPGGDGNCCRLLVGMQRLPSDELRNALSATHHEDEIDNQTALRIKKCSVSPQVAQRVR